MPEKIREKLNKRLRLLRQAFSVMLAVALMVTVLPTEMFGGFSVVLAGESALAEVLKGIVDNNLGKAARYDEITDQMIESTFKECLSGNGNWSSVNIGTLLGSLGSKIKDTVITTDPETGDEIVNELNPWSEKSSASEGSPYSPGVDLFNNPMNAGYTMGALMTDYIRNTNSDAAFLSDAELVEIYDRVAGSPSDPGSNPFVDMDLFKQAVRGAATSASIGGNNNSEGLPYIDTSNYTTYSEYLRSLNGTPIPAKTLFIGTWLLDAQTINETYYRMAVNSMAANNQSIMLYKSELAGNRWRDISGATGLEYILPISETVEDKSLMKYYLSVVVGADGVARSAKTKQPVDIFSLSNPYELESIPELRALKVQFDSDVISDSSTPSKAYIYDRVKSFFNCDSEYVLTDQNKADIDYVFSVAKRTGIAFYAADPRFWGLVRYEESGRGFLESLETAAEIGYRPNYQWGGTNFSRLIRGGIAWTNEVAWEREVNGFGGIGELRRRIWSFQDFWGHYSNVRDDVTRDYDRRLAGMGNIYNQLLGTGNADDRELADMALLIEERLDAGRRAEVYYNLCENSNHNIIIGPLLQVLYQWVAYGESSIGRNYEVISHTDDDSFTAVSSITEAVESALTESYSSYLKYNALVLEEGSTVSSKMEYDLTEYVVNNATGGTGAVRNSLRDLIDLGNINNNVIAHKSRELLLLDRLLTTADSKYSQAVHESAGATYREAAADASNTEATLKEILDDQKADVMAVGAELQRFIKGRAIRLKTADAITFVEGRINWADTLRNGISTDAFGPYAEAALEDHLEWLKMLLASIKAGGEIMDEAEEIEEKKAELENDLKDAYDNDDLEKAAEIKNNIEKVQAQLDDANKKKNDIASMAGSTAADIANAEQVNTPQAVADDIINKLLDNIYENNFDHVSDGLDALEALSSPKIDKLVEALELQMAPQSLINKAKRLAENNDNTDFADQYPGYDDGNGNGTGGTGEGGNGNGDGGDGTGGNGDGTGGVGDGSSGDGTGGNGDGTGGNGTGEDGTGTGTGIDGNQGSGGGLEAPDYGDGTGLRESDFDSGMRDAIGSDYPDMTDTDKIAAVASLLTFAEARDDNAAYEYGMSLLNDLLNSGNPFIYRQYLPDLSQEYVSLAAIDKCRRYTRFRLVDKEAGVLGIDYQRTTMQQFVLGSASYTFEIGNNVVIKNDDSTDKMDTEAVLQTDPSIRGNSTAQYPYITEKYCGKYLYCTCVYIPGTEWAILITPQVDKRIALLLDAFDLQADGE